MPSAPQNSMSYVLWWGSFRTPSRFLSHCWMQKSMEALTWPQRPRSHGTSPADPEIPVDLHDAAQLAVPAAAWKRWVVWPMGRAERKFWCPFSAWESRIPSAAARAPGRGRGGRWPGRSSTHGCSFRGSCPRRHRSPPSTTAGRPLAQDRGGYQNGEVGAHRLQDLRRQRGGEEGLGELLGGLQEARPVLDQIRAELLNGGESSRVPGE